jgi:uncharacterized protein YcbX
MSDPITINDIRVESIFCTPIKSCRQLRLDEAFIVPTGILLDREYMVIDDHGTFVSQRNAKVGDIVTRGVRSMCLIAPGFEDDHLVVRAPEMPELRLPLFETTGKKITARIWMTECDAREVSSIASDWFTMFMSRERPGRYRLVRMDDEFVRTDSAGASLTVFSDGFPFLITSRESHDEVSRRAEFDVPTDRFRPTIVIKGGGKPHFEDALDRIRIGAVEFEGQWLCDRCPMPGVDQATAQKDGRPLLALAKYRRMKDGSDKVQFGRNFSHRNNGRIRPGYRVEVLKLAA